MSRCDDQSSNERVNFASGDSRASKRKDITEVQVPGRGLTGWLQSIYVKFLLRSLTSAPKTRDLPILDMDRYRDMVGKLPAPSDTQIEDFAEYVSMAHSWYKHLPLVPPGIAFCCYIDRFSGYARISRYWGKPHLRLRTEASPGFHYNWMTTENYRARFGYLAYAAGAGTSLAVTSPSGFVHSDDHSPAVCHADGSGFRLPPDVVAAGSVHLTAMIHRYSNQRWVWMRWFLDFPEASTELPEDPQGTAVISELRSFYSQIRDPALRDANWKAKLERMEPTFQAMESLIEKQRALQLGMVVTALKRVRGLIYG